MSNPAEAVDEPAAAIRKSVRDHWVLFVIEGIVFLILGFLASLVPKISAMLMLDGEQDAVDFMLAGGVVVAIALFERIRA